MRLVDALWSNFPHKSIHYCGVAMFQAPLTLKTNSQQTQTYYYTHKQTDRLIERKTNKQIDVQTEIQTYGQFHKHASTDISLLG